MSEAVEAEVRGLCEAGNPAQAAEAAIRGYGGEVFGFLVARMADADKAGDVFSQTCEDLWKTIESFQWRCSMRTWMYKLARSAAARYVRSPGNRGSRRRRLSQVSEVIDQIRSSTRNHLRTEVKDQFSEIRDELEEDDRTILVLRIDRELSWSEVARVLSDDEDLSDDELKRESARLRQRFQKIKDYLRTRAIELGIIST